MVWRALDSPDNFRLLDYLDYYVIINQKMNQLKNHLNLLLFLFKPAIRNIAAFKIKGSSLVHSCSLRIHVVLSKILWTEEPGGLQSTGSQRVGHN